jgi:hypothetical protein
MHFPISIEKCFQSMTVGTKCLKVRGVPVTFISIYVVNIQLTRVHRDKITEFTMVFFEVNPRSFIWSATLPTKRTEFVPP